MTTFETIREEGYEFGDDLFLQIAHKRAVSDDGETRFVAITRGYYDPDGAKRYKVNLTYPENPILLDFITNWMGHALNDRGTDREEAFGNNNFAQVERKAPDDTREEKIAITRGYYDAQGGKRYKTQVHLPVDPELITWAKTQLKTIAQNVRGDS